MLLDLAELYETTADQIAITMTTRSAGSIVAGLTGTLATSGGGRLHMAEKVEGIGAIRIRIMKMSNARFQDTRCSSV